MTLLPMPTVLRKNGFRFHFYSREGNEPPHIHVEKGDNEGKFWLSPISLSDNYGFSSTEISKIIRIIKEHRLQLIDKYKEFHEL